MPAPRIQDLGNCPGRIMGKYRSGVTVIATDKCTGHGSYADRT